MRNTMRNQFSKMQKSLKCKPKNLPFSFILVLNFIDCFTLNKVLPVEKLYCFCKYLLNGRKIY